MIATMTKFGHINLSNLFKKKENPRLTEDKLNEILDKESLMMSVLPKGSKEIYYRKLRDTDLVWYRTVMGLSENVTNSRKRANANNWDHDLTIEALAILWFKQKGRCALTGVMLEYESGSQHSKNPNRASIDRIDNDLGYVQGNVRLLSHYANNAKSTWSDETFMNFAKAAVKYNAKRIT